MICRQYEYMLLGVWGQSSQTLEKRLTYRITWRLRGMHRIISSRYVSKNGCGWASNPRKHQSETYSGIEGLEVAAIFKRKTA